MSSVRALCILALACAVAVSAQDTNATRGDTRGAGLLPIIGYGRHVFLANDTVVTVTIGTFLPKTELGASARNMSREAIVERLDSSMLTKIRNVLEPFHVKRFKDYGWIISAKMDLPEDVLKRLASIGGRVGGEQARRPQSSSSMSARAGGEMFGEMYGPPMMEAPPGLMPVYAPLREPQPTAAVRTRGGSKSHISRGSVLERQMKIQRQQQMAQELMNQVAPLMEFTGYEATKTLDFEVPISDLPLLLDKLNSINASVTVDNLRYAITPEESQKAMSAALEAAGKDAVQHADALYKGLGQKLGKLLVVRDVTMRHPRRHALQHGASFTLQFPAYAIYHARVEALFTAA